MRLLSLSLLMTAGCLALLWQTIGNSPKSPVSFVRWVENPQNGLLVNSEAGDLEFSLQYKPHEYLALKELKKEEASQSELQEKVKNMDEMQYYTFRIKIKDGKDLLKYRSEGPDDYQKNLEYLSFDIQKHFTLIEGGKTLPCLLHHYERTFGIMPQATIVLAFQELNGSHGDKVFVYDDQYFGNGKIRMAIKKEDLNKIPKIKVK